MPKLKTHSGAKKRFRKTAKGVKCRAGFRAHILTKKSPKSKRQKRGQMLVNARDERSVLRMLQGC